jgi:hypothetical protein
MLEVIGALAEALREVNARVETLSKRVAGGPDSAPQAEAPPGNLEPKPKKRGTRAK